MLQHVYERARRASRLEQVWVATDDPRIMESVQAFGGRAVMTSADHLSGTDRVAEAAALPDADGIEVVVNIQGDQPLVAPEALDALVAAFDDDPATEMATLYEPLAGLKDLLDPHVAKVVMDRRGNALYFSRSPIPYHRGEGVMAEAAAQMTARLPERHDPMAGYFKHVGVYAFTRGFLFAFSRLRPGALEEMEGLEQLRALESGHRIRLVPSAGLSLSVETPGDLERVEAIMSSSSS